MSIEHKKIILIENQKLQFKELSKHLTSEGYDVFPEDDNYEHFLNAIKVILNKNYAKDYVAVAKSYVENYLRQKNVIHLFILDFIIGGNYDSDKGTDLARYFRSIGFSHVPFMILSGIESNSLAKSKDEIKFKEGYENYSEWIEKGYFGRDYLEFEYIRDKLLEAIQNLSLQNERQLFLTKLDKLLKHLHVSQLQIFDYFKNLIENPIVLKWDLVKNSTFREEVDKLYMDQIDPLTEAHIYFTKDAIKDFIKLNE